MSMSTEAAQSGAIHNIGYREYDGLRLGRRQTSKAVYGQTLRGAFGIGRGLSGKIFPWFLAGGALLPALILVIVQSQLPVNPQQGPQALVGLNQYTMFIVAVPMLYLAAQAPQAFSRDLRFNVLPLYFSRQLTYGDYVRARLAGLWTAASIMLVAPLVLLYLGGLLISLPVLELTAALLASSVSVLFLTAMLTAVSALIASVTPRRGLGVAAIIAVVVGSFTMAQFVQAIAWSFGTEQSAAWLGVVSPVTIYDGVQSFVFQGEPFNFATSSLSPTPGAAAGIVLILAGFTIIYGCYQLLLLRYRKVSAS